VELAAARRVRCRAQARRHRTYFPAGRAMISAECAANVAAAQEEKRRQNRRKSTPSAGRPLSGALARPPSGREPREEPAPVRQHSLPHDVNHLCRRVSWLENFYEILYACQVDDLHVPFTVVYQYNRPYSAFFSEDGVLRKIESKDLEVPNPAIQAQAHNHQATNVLAELAGKVASKAAVHRCSTGVEAMRVFSRDAVLQGDKDLVVEYQTAEDAESYLLFRSKEQNGIIQRFVQPSTPKVISYRVYWTPHHSQIEAVSNNHLADAADLPVERRCCTFDGHQSDVSASALNKAVEKKINAATHKIIAAVRRLMPRRVDIQMCILHFKAGSGGRVWFLYCGSLRLLDGSDSRPVLGGKAQIGASELETKRRLYAVTTDRPRTARAEEPQLPPAKGRAAQKRKGRECVVSGAFLGKDGHLKYEATFRDIMLHFLWYGLSSGFEKLGDKDAAKKALQNEERVARMLKLMSGSVQVRRSLRHLLTGDPSCPLLFVKNPAAAQKTIDEDELLRASYRLWNDALTTVFARVVDNLVEETFSEKKAAADFLQQVAPVSEEVFLELSTSLTKLLMGWDGDKAQSAVSRTRPREPKHGSPEQSGAARRSDKENLLNYQPAISDRSRRSASCPPGKPKETPAKFVKFSSQVEERMPGTGEFGHLRGEEAQELAQHLMKDSALHVGSFFGYMQGNRWRHPQPDCERFMRNEVNPSEFLYWFHLYASVGLCRPSPKDPPPEVSSRNAQSAVDAMALSFRPGTHMSFNDLVDFLWGVGLMPSRVSRASAAHVFHAVNKDHTVNDDEVRHLDSNEFVQYVKKLLGQVVVAER